MMYLSTIPMSTHMDPSHSKEQVIQLHFVVVQSPSRVRLCVTPRTAAHQASPSLTISWSLPKFMPMELVMLSNHLILAALFSFCLQSFPESLNVYFRWVVTANYNSLIYESESEITVVSDSLWPHESHNARPPCPSPTPRVYPNSRPSSRWFYPAILSSVLPFS